jgi:hypothetical protein
MPNSVQFFEVLGNLAICVFLDEGDVLSFIPGNLIMQAVDRHEIQPEQRWRVVLSNKHQKFFVQKLLDVFVALQSSQNYIELGVEAHEQIACHLRYFLANFSTCLVLNLLSTNAS